MKNILKTASIVTSGIIVGALVRKFAPQAITISKESALDSIKSVKHVLGKERAIEDVDHYFV